MDIGKFKSSRTRLVLWILLPPLIITGIGLSAYALRLQAEWELNRTRLLSNVLPELAQTRQDALELVSNFHASTAYSIQSEDDLIAYIREIERKAEFTIDTLEVERKSTKEDVSVLTAQVEGEGSFEAIQTFMSDVVSGQHLLFGSQLDIAQAQGLDAKPSGQLTANVTFELILLDSLKTLAAEGE